MARRLGNGRAWVWTAVAAVAAVASVLVPGRFDERMPDPNGFDDLVAAGRAVKGQTPNPKGLDYSAMDPATLRAYVDDNREPLERARVGLSRESRVRLPIRFMDPVHIENTTMIRGLARVFACESALAELGGDAPRAAAIDMEVIRLGRAAGAGGILIDHSVAMAVESVGMAGLSRVVPKLPAADARRIATELVALDAGHEKSGRVVARETAYMRARAPWQMRAMVVLAPSAVGKLRGAADAAFAQADLRAAAYRRLLALKLALRAYRLDHPDAPAPPTLAALVPGDIAAVPADPFGKGPLKLKADGKGDAYAYSVGPDGVDDGGTSVSLAKLLQPGATGDLTLDLP